MSTTAYQIIAVDFDGLIFNISYQPQIHTPIQYEYQIAPTPPDQNNPDYPVRTYLLYVLQSLLPTQPENYILPLI